MHRRVFHRPGLGLLALAVTLAGCVRQPVIAPAPDAAGVRAAYDHALLDAATIEPGEVLELKPVTGDSVTVVVWTAYRGYLPDTEREMDRLLWVTLEGEVRDSCRRFTPGNLTLRLQQLLGLPPKEEDRVFVVLRAASRDLVRPCGSPDTATRSCPHPAVPGAWREDEQILDELARQTQGFPWTRLGYTFDWGSRAKEYGASEYVIRKGARVRVLSVHPTEAYCGADAAPPESLVMRS